MRDYYDLRAFNPSPALEAEFIALGLYDYKYEEKETTYSRSVTLKLRIPATDSRLTAALALQEQHRFFGRYITEFDDDDYARAEWLEADIVSWLGYPKPESDWQSVTYDLAHSDYCPRCDVGISQVNPFRLAKSHRRGKTVSFCRPGWVPDALFVTASVRDTLLAEGLKGMKFLAAIEAGSKTPFDDVIQLLCERTLEPGLINGNDFQQEVCSRCGRHKFNLSERVKRFRRDVFDQKLDFAVTGEWFGSGGLACKMLIVSRQFAELYEECRWRGLRLRPIVLE